MKKIFFLFSVFCFFIQLVGCGPSKAELEAHQKQGEVFDPNTGKYVKVANNPYEENTEEPQVEEISYDDIEIRVIDSCEYILWYDRHHGLGNLTHKANCRNPFHQNNN